MKKKNVKRIKFIHSRVLSFYKRDGDQYILINFINGKLYALSEKAYLIFCELNKPTDVINLRKKFKTIDEESLTALLEYLQSRHLIFNSDDDKIDETFQIISPNQPFFQLPHFDTLTDNHENLVLVGVPFGGGNSISLSSKNASSTLRNYSNLFKLSLNKIEEVNNLEKIFPFPTNFSSLRKFINAKKIKDAGDLYINSHEYIENIYAKIEKLASLLITSKQTPIFIGGDHSITLPILKAYNRKYENLHVIHLDAHTDTYVSKLDDFYKNKTPHHHGNFAYFAQQLNNIKNIYQFGIRGISNIGISPITSKQKIYYIQETLDIIKNHSKLKLPENGNYYITIDIDVLNPQIAPATATPVTSGLSFQELVELLEMLSKNKNIVGIDLVEFAPEKDVNNITSQLCIELLFVLTNLLAKSKK